MNIRRANIALLLVNLGCIQLQHDKQEIGAVMPGLVGNLDFEDIWNVITNPDDKEKAAGISKLIKNTEQAI